jgi:hypothetical protein
MTTAVEIAASKVTTLLATPGTKWSDLVKALVTVAEEQAVETVESEVRLPEPVFLSEREKEALAILEARVDATGWPKARKELTSFQRTSMIKLLSSTKVLKDLVERIEAQTKIAAWNHLDVELEKSDEFDEENTQRDKWGYYAVRGSIEDPQTGLRIDRDVRAASAKLTAEDLATLETDGVITHAEFLDLTAPARVIEPTKFMHALSKDRTLVTRIASATQAGTPSNAMVLRGKD